MKFPKFFVLLTLSLLVWSCNDDDDGTNGNSVDCASFASDTEVQTAMDTYVEAATTYGQDPTEENCNALIASLDHYLEVVDIYVRDCASNEEFQQWQESIDEWRDERDQLDCGG